MGPQSEFSTIAFGEYVLDAGKRELQGPSGPVKLVGKPFDVLVYLILHRDRLIPGKELFSAVWRTDGPVERVYDPESVQQAVSSIRRALGDNARSPRYLLTDRGRGIRFIASVN